MPSGIPKGSTREIDHLLKQLADAINLHIQQEAEKGHLLPETTIRKRLLLAIRAHGILPLRKAITQDDDLMGLREVPNFTQSDGRFEPWTASANRKPPAQPEQPADVHP